MFSFLSLHNSAPQGLQAISTLIVSPDLLQLTDYTADSSRRASTMDKKGEAEWAARYLRANPPQQKQLQGSSCGLDYINYMLVKLAMGGQVISLASLAALLEKIA